MQQSHKFGDSTQSTMIEHSAENEELRTFLQSAINHDLNDDQQSTMMQSEIGQEDSVSTFLIQSDSLQQDQQQKAQTSLKHFRVLQNHHNPIKRD